MSAREPWLAALREKAEACERAYREYGLGASPTDAMITAREEYEQVVEEPETVLALLDIADAALAMFNLATRTGFLVGPKEYPNLAAALHRAGVPNSHSESE